MSISVPIADDILHLPLKVSRTVSNPNDKRIGIGLAVQGPVPAQKRTGGLQDIIRK